MEARKLADKIIRDVNYVELAKHETFRRFFQGVDVGIAPMSLRGVFAEQSFAREIAPSGRTPSRNDSKEMYG